jgi:hypothetical protein
MDKAAMASVATTLIEVKVASPKVVEIAAAVVVPDLVRKPTRNPPVTILVLSTNKSMLERTSLPVGSSTTALFAKKRIQIT